MRTLLLFILAAAAALGARAQGGSSVTGGIQTGTAYYSFLRPGEIPIEVFVLGEVRSPGVYAVGLGMELNQLLALTGGVAYGPGDERYVVSVSLYHETPNGRVLAYEEPLDRVVVGGPSYPPLEDGDVVVIDVRERRQWLTFDNALRILTAVASLYLVFDRITR